MTTLDEMLRMRGDDLYEIVRAGRPLDLDALADTTYTGIDLSMPAWFHALMWRSFRKTFYRDPASGRLRGWNVKVEQTGWDTPPAAKRRGDGSACTFGHYEVSSAEGIAFPRGWRGAHYLDYRVAGNSALDVPARYGFCPLVSVNEGSSDLLLGWEIFKFGGLAVPLSDYWVLKREGPLDGSDVVARPDGQAPAPRDGLQRPSGTQP